MQNTKQKLQEQLQIAEANWKRSLADYHNLVKRVDSEKREFSKYAATNLISKLIPCLDILILAATHSQDPGVNMAVKQFQQVLQDEGLQIINPQIGSLFDHNLHECVETVSGETANTITEVVAQGYQMADFVIRPAKVKVVS